MIKSLLFHYWCGWDTPNLYQSVGIKILKPITIHLSRGSFCEGFTLAYRLREKGSAGMRFVERLAMTAYAPNSCLRQTLPRARGPNHDESTPPKFNITTEKWYLYMLPKLLCFLRWNVNKHLQEAILNLRECNTWLFLTPFIAIYQRIGATAPSAIPIPSPVHLRRLPAFQLLTSWQVSTMQPAPWACCFTSCCSRDSQIHWSPKRNQQSQYLKQLPYTWNDTVFGW